MSRFAVSPNATGVSQFDDRIHLVGLRLISATCGAALAVLLVWSVARFISGPFRYLGYTPRAWHWDELVVAAICAVLLFFIAGDRAETPGRAGIAFLVVFVGLPVLLLPVFYGTIDRRTLAILSLVVVGSFGIIRIFHCLAPMVSLPRIPDVFPPALLLGLLSVASLALVIGLTGISIDWVSLTNAYEQRDEYSAASSSVVAYALGWTGGGALAALAAYGYHLRSWFYMAIGFGGLAAIYMLTGYKSYLLGAALVLVLALIFGRSREVRVWRVYLIFGGAISAAGVMDWVTGSNFFTSLGVRRAFSTAGINTGYFIDFFEKHPKYGLRHSVLSFMGEPPFSTSPAKLIGSVYYSQEGVAANANFLADGMANFGFGGMLGASAVVGIWLGFVDLVAAELPAGIVFAAIAVVLVAFSNTASLTVLATHGGAASLIALWIVGEDWRRRSVAMQSAEEVSGSSKLAQTGDAQTL